MHIRTFRELSLRSLNSHLAAVWNAQNTGRINWRPGATALYPQILLCVETADWHVVELVGGRQTYHPLIVKNHRTATLDSYLGQLDMLGGTPMILLENSTNVALAGLILRQEGTDRELTRRFPQVSQLFGATLVGAGPAKDGKLLDVRNSSNYIRVENCLMVHKREAAVRIHDVLFMLVIKRSEKESTYRAYLNALLHPSSIHGLRVVPRGAYEYVSTAASFASFYLRDQLRETTIGEFLNRHRDILLTAFGAQDLLYEPYLEWQEGNPDPSEKAINPDLLVKRIDGAHDICELKLPLVDRLTLTKGERRRRRFVDKVQEGIAQLAHYVEYFQYPANRAWANERYGVRIENPRKILIVGNYENINVEHINEASRMLGSYDLIDYDTILQLYLAGKGVNTTAFMPS